MSTTNKEEKVADVSTENIYRLNGRVPLKKAIPFGLQHVLAMFVSNLAPVLIVCSAALVRGTGEHLTSAEITQLLQCAMFVAGIGTCMQLYPVWKIGSGLPIVMGVSFTFLGSLLVICTNPELGYEGMVGAVILGGIFEGLVGLSARYWKRFLTPVVSACVVIAIGLSLLSVGMDSWGGGSGVADFGAWYHLVVGAFTLIVCLVARYLLKGVYKNLNVLVGLILGYLLAIIFTVAGIAPMVDFSGITKTVQEVGVFSLPKLVFLTSHKPIFDLGAFLTIAIVFLVSAAETTGATSAVCTGALDREIKMEELQGSLAVDGFSSALSGCFGCLPLTSFSQNVGLVTMTQVINRFTILMGAFILILSSLFPPLGAFFNSLPQAVLGGCLLLMYTVIAILMIFMERKVCAAFQCRLGPMRVGPWGTVQVICDVFKMLTKEIITIRRSDKFLYNLAPYIVILASVLAFACLPVNKGLEVLDFNVGIFFMMAASSIGVVGILLAGWSSNNKYSLIGAMRSGAQMISYELSIGLSILTIIVLTDTMQFSEIVARQADGWFLFKGHIPALIAFVIYLIAGNAEVNRGPFDLPEAESELTAGYHTEYSGMHFGLFYVAEFVNLFIVAGVAATIFLGGWMPLHIAGWEGFNAVMDCIPGFVWFFAKAFFVVWLLMWIKWTFPRLRIDQILTLEWKYLVPIGLANLLLMVIVVVFKLHF